MRPQTNSPLRIAPSVLTADFGHLATTIERTEDSGADWIHLDVMDGHFVPNITFGPMLVATIRNLTTLPLDVHLMIDDPDKYLNAFSTAGADTITVHAEACPHLHNTVLQIIDLGCRAGVAINPATPVESLREISPFVDLILIMSVNPGFGGQQFIQTSTNKIRRTRKMLDELNPTCDLEVDGGIDAGNIAEVVHQGANAIVVGSAVYDETGNIEKNIAALRAAPDRSDYQ